MIHGDYIGLMLILLVAAMFTAAVFFWKGLDLPLSSRHWAGPFAAVGLPAFLIGLHMVLVWPMPGKASFANVAFGEPMVLLGTIFLGAALAMAKGWDLLPMGILAFLTGIVSVIIGAQIYNVGLTLSPPMTAAGFILTGVCGVVAPLVLMQREFRLLRQVYALLLAAAGALWAVTAFAAYWGHIGAFAKAAG